jgi:hypothetical protein
MEADGRVVHEALGRQGLQLGEVAVRVALADHGGPVV